MRGERNVVSNVLLVAIAVTGGVLVWVFIASLLGQVQSSASVSGNVSSVPLRIDTAYQTADGNICLVVRNPNADSVPVSSLRAYVYENDVVVKTYDSFSSSCGSEIPGGGSCTLCTPAEPPTSSGNTNIILSSAGTYSSAPLYIHTPWKILRYPCATCDECNTALNDAASKIVSGEVDEAVVTLSADITQTSAICISLSGYDTAWKLTFDGNNHTITGNSGTGILLENVTGIIVSDLNLNTESNGIIVKSSGLHLVDSNLSGNFYSVYVSDTNDVYIDSSYVGGDTGIQIVNGNVYVSASQVTAATGVYFSGNYAHLYVDLASGDVLFCPSGEGGASFDADATESGFVGEYNIFCMSCGNNANMYYSDNPLIDESVLIQCDSACVDFCP